MARPPKRGAVEAFSSTAGAQLDVLRPMLLSSAKQAFDDEAWGFEIKYDGWRMFGAADGTGAQLRTRTGANATSWFPEVRDALLELRGAGGGALGGFTLFDGELAVVNDLGIAGDAEFQRLQARARMRGFRPGADVASFLAFDVLWAEGEPVMHLPLHQRKAILKELIPAGTPNMLVVSQIHGAGRQLFQAALQLGLEGVIAKRLDSAYEPGVRTPNWLKVKRPGAVPAQRFDHRR